MTVLSAYKSHRHLINEFNPFEIAFSICPKGSIVKEQHFHVPNGNCEYHIENMAPLLTNQISGLSYYNYHIHVVLEYTLKHCKLSG